jgi:hypothetical protein
MQLFDRQRAPFFTELARTSNQLTLILALFLLASPPTSAQQYEHDTSTPATQPDTTLYLPLVFTDPADVHNVAHISVTTANAAGERKTESANVSLNTRGNAVATLLTLGDLFCAPGTENSLHCEGTTIVSATITTVQGVVKDLIVGSGRVCKDQTTGITVTRVAVKTTDGEPWPMAGNGHPAYENKPVPASRYGKIVYGLVVTEIPSPDNFLSCRLFS